MRATVLKDATLTVKAGQVVEISAEQFALAKKLGLVAKAPAEKQKKKASK